MAHNDSAWTKALEIHTDSLQGCVDSLQAKLDALQYKTDFLSNVIETANDGVSNQLASATFWLEVIAIIIAIVGIWLSLYINHKKRQIDSIATTVEGKKQEVDRMTHETEKLDEKIRHNLSDLYKDLRKEETNALLDRLILEPRDISNIVSLMFARDLEEESFPKLREAYLKLVAEEKQNIEDDNNYSPQKEDKKDNLFSNLKIPKERNYILLFFQHYSYLALKDTDIRPKLVENFPTACRLAFKRDIIKSTIDLCKALSEENSTFNKEDVLTAYLKALNDSDHKKYEDLRNILKQNIIPQTLLENSINRCIKEGTKLVLFMKE